MIPCPSHNAIPIIQMEFFSIFRSDWLSYFMQHGLKMSDKTLTTKLFLANNCFFSYCFIDLCCNWNRLSISRSEKYRKNSSQVSIGKAWMWRPWEQATLISHQKNLDLERKFDATVIYMCVSIMGRARY